MTTASLRRSRIIGLGIIAASLLFFSWYGVSMTCGCVQKEEGRLEGMVTIGPLCPVEPCTLTPDQVRAACASRKVLVYAEDGRTLLRVLAIDPEAGYAAVLPAGTYVVDINRIGIDWSDDVPREVTIRPGGTVRLDIAIDTGIR
jgi:hypothetical protein